MISLDVILAALLGYLLGSIPFGLLLTRAAGLGDIRAIGSGNIGATNVLRTGNKALAAATLLLDAAKGAAAVLAARYLWGEGPAMMAGVAAFLGHVFPVWLSFKGGKGVATYIGVLLGLNWIVGLIFCATWLVIAVAQRYSSLAALTAAATAPIFAYVLSGLDLAAAAAVLSVILTVRHAANIQRLIRGTEPRIGSDRPKAD
ncbi:glycerol-3-phosphate 1-O-acyltransferase PlsY [Devosia sp.]|uniref:glycerol-3-phosphate 1-O-acyltransferase PlsY n=1 Tax=Devosia sp. TaxID=1871048 RepID=UPI003751C346